MLDALVPPGKYRTPGKRRLFVECPWPAVLRKDLEWLLQWVGALRAAGLVTDTL